MNVMTGSEPQQETPHYVAEMGMVRAPFAPDVDDDFFYAEPGRIQRLDMLVSLIQHGNELLLVTGPTGSGKTTLIRQLRARSGAGWQSCLINGASSLSAAGLLTQLAVGFGLPGNDPDPERLEHTLSDYFESINRCSQRALILVDDAHLLSRDTLAQLVDIANRTGAEGEPLVRITLFAEASLLPALTDGQKSGPPNALRKLDLAALAEQETGNYIRHRLAVAGLITEGPFAAAMVQKIHRQSGGIPGEINRLAHRLLMESVGRRERKAVPDFNLSPASRRIPLRNIIAIAIAVAVVMLLVFQDDINTRVRNSVDKPSAEQTTNTVALASEDPKAVSTTDTVEPTQPPPPDEPVEHTQQAVTTPLENIAVFPEPTQSDVDMEPAATPDSSAADDTAAARLAPDTTPEPPDTLESGLATELDLNDASWLLEQPAAGYTIQLLGAAREATIRRFAATAKLGKPGAYYLTLRRSQPWHVLVFGSYPTRTEARAALAGFPPALAATAPWIRPLSEIHQEAGLPLQ